MSAKRAWQWFLGGSLWLASIGLMLASSGIDGAYLAKLMPAGLWWLGLLLNTVADVASEIMMYWYGRLQQDGTKAKRVRSRYVLAFVGLLTAYAWLFGWRQLLPALRELEGDAAWWLAPLVAGFVPLALAGAGYVQALLAGKIETESATAKPKRAEPQLEPVAELAEPHVCETCGYVAKNQNALNGHQRAHKRNGHKERVAEVV